MALKLEDIDWRAGEINVRGKGLFQAIEFVRDRATKERFPDSVALGVQVGRRALAHGLLCRFDPHWIAFGPPLIVTAEQIDEMVAILDRSLGEILGERDGAANLAGGAELGPLP